MAPSLLRSLAIFSLWFVSVTAAHSQSYSVTSLPGRWMPYTRGYADGTNSWASFDKVGAIAAGQDGSLFVSDSQYSTIRRLTPIGTDWVLTTLAGFLMGYADGTNSDARFRGPEGLAIARDDNVYIADTINHKIRKMAPIGTNWVVSTLAGGGPGLVDGVGLAAQFNYPHGLALDATGNLYIADAGNNVIRKMTPTGTNWVVSTLAGGGSDKWGTADGTNRNARFYLPRSLAMDGAGNVYVTDGFYPLIRRLTKVGTDWVVTTIAGSTTNETLDGTNCSAHFSGPDGIAVDKQGNIYVGDYRTIRKITPLGGDWIVTTLAGKAGVSGDQDGSAEDARFNRISDLAVDSCNNLFVTDSGGRPIVRMLQPYFSLQMTYSGTQTVLRWPSLATAFALEKSSWLTATSIWTPMTNGVALVGDSCFFTNSSDSPAAFFRLRKN